MEYLVPIGIQEAKAIGKSIFFLLEANPGPGLGVLSSILDVCKRCN